LPLAFVFGRRPIFLFSVILAFITVLTAGSSQGYEGHFISRIFLGLATGATESVSPSKIPKLLWWNILTQFPQLLPLIISDATFLDERSFYFGIYWSVQNCVSAGLQIGLSYLTAAGTWRWYYWLFAITLGLSIMFAFFLLPETRFQRPASSVNGQIIYTDEFGTTHFLSDEDARERFGDIAQPVNNGSVARKRSLMQELKPWSPVADNGFKIWAGAYGKILKSLSSPGVIFAMLASSISLGIGVAITLIYSTILEESYGWSASSVGLFNIGIIPASFLAMLHSGWLADKINVRLAARNGGVHRPEHHLIYLIVPYLTGATGIIVFGVCANDPQAYSAWGLVIGKLFIFFFPLRWRLE
jgi:MFS family permease